MLMERNTVLCVCDNSVCVSVIVYSAVSIAVILLLAVVIGTIILFFIQRKRRAK